MPASDLTISYLILRRVEICRMAQELRAILTLLLRSQEPCICETIGRIGDFDFHLHGDLIHPAFWPNFAVPTTLQLGLRSACVLIPSRRIPPAAAQDLRRNHCALVTRTCLPQHTPRLDSATAALRPGCHSMAWSAGGPPRPQHFALIEKRQQILQPLHHCALRPGTGRAPFVTHTKTILIWRTEGDSVAGGSTNRTALFNWA